MAENRNLLDKIDITGSLTQDGQRRDQEERELFVRLRQMGINCCLELDDYIRRRESQTIVSQEPNRDLKKLEEQFLRASAELDKTMDLLRAERKISEDCRVKVKAF